MEEMMVSWMDWINPETILKQGGIWLLLLIIFLETGIFVGVFLPGDSLLLTAGLLCGTMYLQVSLHELILGLTVAGFLGSVAGYAFGFKTGGYLLRKRENIFFKKKYFSIAEDYYLRYGNAAFVIGRFLPVARTFLPILAGLVKARWGTFLVYNALGTGIWVSVMVGSGYWLGRQFPDLIHSVELLVIALILITSVPLLLSWFRQRHKHSAKSKIPHS